MIFWNEFEQLSDSQKDTIKTLSMIAVGFSIFLLWAAGLFKLAIFLFHWVIDT